MSTRLRSAARVTSSVRHSEKRHSVKLSQTRLEATIIAKQIVSGDIDAYDGAQKIWKEILNNVDERIPDDLWPFKSNANAITCAK